MEIFIKVAPRDFEQLRSRIPTDSPAHDAIIKATPSAHSVEGVLFEGYNIACDENQARIILELAKGCCPDIVPDIEEAMRTARPG